MYLLKKWSTEVLTKSMLFFTKKKQILLIICIAISLKTGVTKVLFTDRCRRQNFCPSLLCLVDRLYIVIQKTQKTRMKVLPSATVGE